MTEKVTFIQEYDLDQTDLASVLMHKIDVRLR